MHGRQRSGFTQQPENSKRAHLRANTTLRQEREKRRAKFWAVQEKGGPGKGTEHDQTKTLKRTPTNTHKHTQTHTNTHKHFFSFFFDREEKRDVSQSKEHLRQYSPLVITIPHIRGCCASGSCWRRVLQQGVRERLCCCACQKFPPSPIPSVCHLGLGGLRSTLRFGPRQRTHELELRLTNVHPLLQQGPPIW